MEFVGAFLQGSVPPPAVHPLLKTRPEQAPHELQLTLVWFLWVVGCAWLGVVLGSITDRSSDSSE